MSTSTQYLSVPQLTRRPSQHRSDRGPRAPAQSPPQAHPPPAAKAYSASSSKVKLEDTPLGTSAPLGAHVPLTTTAPTQTSPVQTVRTLTPTPAASSLSISPTSSPPSPPSRTVIIHRPHPPNLEFELTCPNETGPALPAQHIPRDAVPRATALSTIRSLEPLVHFRQSAHARHPPPIPVAQGRPAAHLQQDSHVCGWGQCRGSAALRAQ
jgi:hypothetical protein